MANSRVVVDIVARNAQFRQSLNESVSQTRNFSRELTRLSRNADIVGQSLRFAAQAFSVGFVVQTTQRIDGLNRSLELLAGSSDAAAAEMAFLRITADRLGLELLSTAESYRRILAASQGTTLQGEDARKIFVAVSNAMARLGATSLQSERALIAVEQIISKGKVSAEELRQQLGDALPGAFQIAARSLGLTAQEFDRLLAAGDIFSNDFLPSFADELNRIFSGAEDRVESLSASFNRLRNSLTDLLTTFESAGGGDGIGAISDFLAQAVRRIGLEAQNAGVAVGNIVAQFELLGRVVTGQVGITDYLSEALRLNAVANEQIEDQRRLWLGVADSISQTKAQQEQQAQALQANLIAQQQQIQANTRALAAENVEAFYRARIRLSREALSEEQRNLRQLERQTQETFGKIADIETRQRQSARDIEDQIADARREGLSESSRQFSLQLEIAGQLRQAQIAIAAATKATTDEARKAALEEAQAAQERAQSLASQIDSASERIRLLRQVGSVNQQILNTEKSALQNEALELEKAKTKTEDRINDIESQITTLEKSLNDLTGKDKTVQIKANIAAANKEIEKIKKQLDQLAKGVTIPIRTSGGVNVEQRRWGGFIPGYGGGDRVPALLEAGEYVIRKEAVKRHGLGFLERLNSMQIPSVRLPTIPALPATAQRFQTGGEVRAGEEITLRLDLGAGRQARFRGGRNDVQLLTDTLAQIARASA